MARGGEVVDAGRWAAQWGGGGTSCAPGEGLDQTAREARARWRVGTSLGKSPCAGRALGQEGED